MLRVRKKALDKSTEAVIAASAPRPRRRHRRRACCRAGSARRGAAGTGWSWSLACSLSCAAFAGEEFGHRQHVADGVGRMDGIVLPGEANGDFGKLAGELAALLPGALALELVAQAGGEERLQFGRRQSGRQMRQPALGQIGSLA